MSLRFAGDGTTASELAGVIDAERRCCPFLRFTLELEPGDGLVHLRIAGPEGTADFLAAELGLGGR